MTMANARQPVISNSCSMATVALYVFVMETDDVIFKVNAVSTNSDYGTTVTDLWVRLPAWSLPSVLYSNHVPIINRFLPKGHGTHR